MDTKKIMTDRKVDLDLLFETSWEVCNKIGGIYTVLSTKANTLHKLYKDKLIFIGPDVWSDQTPSPYFIECETPLDKWIAGAELPFGIKARTGRWNVPGKPVVVLVKFDTMFDHNNALFGEIWDKFGVDSLHSYGDYGEACAFSHAAAIVIESICHYYKRRRKVIAHFNEWTTGMGLLLVKDRLPYVATIFTTHATSIGRSICGNGKPLYDYMKGYNGDQMAHELNMEAKHSLEKTAAHNADCFTTVSDITAIECEQLLERKPDVVTPNGFESDFVPSKAKFNKARQTARKKLLSTASALTGKKYDDSTFIAITSGRCEYRNKGLDVFIDVLSRLRTYPLGRPIVAFIMVPAWVQAPRVDLEKALSSKRTSNGLESPYLTHHVNNPWEDAILCSIRRLGLDTVENTRVDVIYVPCYLNGNDGIFNTTYYDLLPGADATVFPSYYEPWGYTPLESVAFYVPTVTTTLSGFGQWVLRDCENSFTKSGVQVVGRSDHGYGETVEEIAKAVANLDNSTEKEIEVIDNAAKATSDKAAWKYFITYYIDAFAMALDSADKRESLS